VRLFALSDLHLGEAGSARMFHDPQQGLAFSELCHEVARSGGELVLAGDIFDITAAMPPQRGLSAFGRAVGVGTIGDRPRRSLAEVLQAIRANNPAALDALDALSHERPVTLVPGNHDRHLLGPEGPAALAAAGLGGVQIEAPTRAGDQVVDLTGKLLFFADEQAKAQFKDRRASARKLYSTICSFREAGSLLPVYGVSHNASREGMYIRTLDPPRPKSSIWLELRAPGSGTPLHLRATAMWQRLPGAGSGVLPPGFGLRLDADRCPALDLQELIAGYEQLAE
jgi:hypothetical protein